MSRKERDRLKVMDQLSRGQIRQTQAAQWLGLSVRQVRRIQSRYAVLGDRGLAHRLRGRPSARRIAPELREQVIELLKSKYYDFGPTLASEHLADDDGIAVSRETVRRWMRQQGLWAGRRKGQPHRRRRARRACFGELVQMDTSTHDWLEGRGERCALITMIDDATGRKLMRFFDADTTLANMSLIRLWIGRHGRPLALYTDWASHFKHPRRKGQKGPLKPTQIERALEELGIELIPAGSPQAKGRVERSHGTDQDRLIKEMRLAAVATMEAANRFLEEVYLPRVNGRFAVQPASRADAHRSAQGHDLDAILSVQGERVVSNDYTVQVDAKTWQIEPGQITGGLRQTKVTVERRLDGTLWMRWRDRYVRYRPVQTVCKVRDQAAWDDEPAVASAAAGVGESPLREGSLRSPSLHSDSPTPAPPNPQHKRIPSPNHPWKKRTLLLCKKEDIPTLR